MRGHILMAALLASSTSAAAQQGPAAPEAEPARKAPLVDLSDAVDPPAPTQQAAAAAPADPPAAEQPFAATLFLTPSYEAFVKAWVKGDEADLPTTTSIGIANPVFGMIVVAGCSRGPDGKCDLELVTRTAGPDGEFDTPRPSPPWKAPPPPGGRRMLSPARFGLSLDRQDPPGRYTIEATVTDRIAKKSVVTTGSAVKPATEPAGR